MSAVARKGPRYLAVAVACVILNIVIMIALDSFGIHYVISSAISFVAVVLLGYALHLRITFEAEGARRHSLWRYTAAMAVNYPATIVLLFLLCDLAGFPIVLAVPIATIAMLAFNFFAVRWSLIERQGARF